MDTLNAVVAHPQAYLLIVCRTSGLFLLAPVLSSASIPALVRVALVLLLASALFPIHGLNVPETSLDVPSLVAALGSELSIGLIVGFVASFIFLAFQMAGALVGTQIGFSIADVFDGSRQEQVPIIDQFYSVLVTLLFLVLDGHHLLILALDRTFLAVPLGAAVLPGAAALPLWQMFTEIFAAALQITLPLLAAFLLAELALGLAARAVPQINVLFVGMPLKILLGLFTLGLALPGTVAAATFQMERGVRDMLTIVRAL